MSIVIALLRRMSFEVCFHVLDWALLSNVLPKYIIGMPLRIEEGA